MKISDIITDIRQKADIEYNNGAKTHMLDYYLPNDIFIAFKKYYKNQRKINSNYKDLNIIQYKYGGITLKKTNNKDLYYKMINNEI